MGTTTKKRTWAIDRIGDTTVGEDDFCFISDCKTGKRTVLVPKKETFTFQEITNVHLAALEFAKITGEMFAECLTKETEKSDG